MSTISEKATAELIEKEQAADEPIVISSYLAILVAGSEKDVLEQMVALPGVEVHGCEHGRHVVSIEAPSIDETFTCATRITQIPGVTTFNLVYCNFEDALR